MNENATSGQPWLKWIALALLVFTIGTLFYLTREWLTFQYLAERESQLREYQSNYPVSVFVIAFLIYVVATGFSLPGATVLSLSYGWYFGFWQGLLMVSFASTTGATIAFLTSRYFIGENVQRRYANRLKKFNESFENEGAFYLFTLRLVPLFPFFVVNLLMGLTKIRISTFWVVSQVGMFPATVVIVFAGSEISIQELAEKGFAGISWKMLAGFAALGILPLLIRKILGLVRRKK